VESRYDVIRIKRKVFTENPPVFSFVLQVSGRGVPPFTHILVVIPSALIIISTGMHAAPS
jgi:hypothetical protein